MVTTVKPTASTWCPGCGDFGVLAAVKKAAAEVGVPNHEQVLVGGIGCSGGIHNFLDTNGLHALHGRLLAQAVGVKLANPKLTVIAAGGDGDGYAIGMGHFIHAFKKNVSLLYIVMNNETYGLTKGQASPTSRVGYEGNVEQPFDAILTALSIPAPNFIARTFSGDPKTMIAVLSEALRFNRKNRGFAFASPNMWGAGRSAAAWIILSIRLCIIFSRFTGFTETWPNSSCSFPVTWARTPGVPGGIVGEIPSGVIL